MPPTNFYTVIRAFQASAKYEALAKNTKDGYAYVLRMAGDPDILGSLPPNRIRPAIVQQFLDGLASRPAIQRRALVALKSLESWAIVRDLIPREITKGCETVGGGGAREPWSDSQIHLAERVCRVDIALLVTLGANTGQRASDIVRMRVSDIETYRGHPGINVTQQKTGLVIWVPFTQDLIEKMKTWERRPGHLCLRYTGLPWTAHQVSDDWWNEVRRNEALAPLREAKLTFHGLRASAVCRLRRQGYTEGEIAKTVGMSVPMVSRYCRQDAQREVALTAMNRTRTEQAQIVPFKTRG